MEINLTNDKGEEKIITYEVIYKRVKNINLRFDANNNLVISAPRYVGKKEIEKVIREYTNWIFKSMKTNENKNSYKLARELDFNDSFYYYYGIKYDLNFININDNNFDKTKTDNKYFLIDHDNKKINFYFKNENDFSWKKDFDKYEKQILIDKLKFYFNKEMNELKNYDLPLTKIKIKTLKSAWGVCQVVKKEITINRKLVNHNEKCLRYVVIHELCHLIHANHSKEFYKVIESVMPDYKKAKHELNYD